MQKWRLTGFALLVSLSLFAQDFSTAVFPINGGRDVTKIRRLFELPEGALLAGTSNGLYRFDGIGFTACALAADLQDYAVASVGRGEHEQTWVGFQNGALARYDNGRVFALSYDEGAFGKAVNAIVLDSNERVWCATAGEGLYCRENGKWYNINEDDGLSDSYVYALLQQGSAMVACTDAGINVITFQYGKKAVRHWGAAQGLADNICTAVLQPDGLPLIVAHQDKGLSFVRNLQSSAPDIQSLQKQWTFGQVFDLAYTNGYLYASTELGGLMVAHCPVGCDLTKLEFSAITPGNPGINPLLQTSNGFLFAGVGNALVRIDHPHLQLIKPFDSKLAAEVHACTTDRQGNFVYAYDNNVVVLHNNDKATHQSFRISGLPAEAEISCLYADEYSSIWAGTMGYGVWKVNTVNSIATRFTEDSLLVNGSILSIWGRGNEIWISSLAGATRLRLLNAKSSGDMEVTDFSAISGLGTNYIYHIFPDSKQNVWFATDGKGLVRYRDGVFRHFGEREGLKGNVVYGIAEDGKGRIWVNVLHNGLFYIENDSCYQLTTEDGLSSNEIAAIVSSGEGNILAITTDGLDVVNASGLFVQHWGPKMGVRNLKAGLHSATTLPHSGIGYLSDAGAFIFRPPKGSAAPKPYLTSVELFLEPIDTAAGKRWDHASNNLGFRFDAVDLIRPEIMLFQYKLEGFSPEWITTRDRYVNFPSLPPGDYTFMVRASEAPGFRNAGEVQYSFSIAKPFWLQWWFMVVTFFTLTGLVWTIIRWRERHFQHLQALKEESLQSQLETLKSQVSPHFFFNSLNTLVSLIEEEPKVAVEYTTQLADFFREVVQYRDTDTIPLGEEMKLIDRYFFIQQKRFGKALVLHKNISNGAMQYKKVAPLTLQMLVENAIKHNALSLRNPLEINISIMDDRLVVSNNLQPKLQQERSAGMGIQHIQRRYRLLTGKSVEVEQDDKYFEVSVPLI